MKTFTDDEIRRLLETVHFNACVNVIAGYKANMRAMCESEIDPPHPELDFHRKGNPSEYEMYLESIFKK
jgi:hypothetical protein